MSNTLQAPSGGAIAQNDIADFLRAVIDFFKLPTDEGLGKILGDIADFFDRLTQTHPELAAQMSTQDFNLCAGELLEAIRTDAMLAAGGVLKKLPGHVEKFVDCSFGTGTQAQPLNRSLLIQCGIAAVMTWLRTGDVTTALTQFVSCVLGGVGDTPPAGGLETHPVKRC